jgi:uncharacterized OB-fold protein
MALIKCGECGNEVSTKASSCVNCGAPISTSKEIKAVGSKLYTTQATSKKLKLHSLISSGLIILGIIMLANSGSEPTTTPILLMLLGLFWFILNRVRIWWHHK